MAFASTDLTESAPTPFKLLDSAFPVLRSFLDVMPMTSLFFLRQESDTVKSMSRFRGEIIDNLSIITDTVEPWNDQYESYSNIVQRPYNVTPCCLLDLYMGPDICPEAVLSKMNEQSYTRLHMSGDYDWKQVVSFLHTGISNCVCLYDFMDLPDTDMDEFFKILVSYKIKEFCLLNENGGKPWVDAAFRTWSSLIGTVFKTVEVSLDTDYLVVAVTQEGTELVLVVKCDDLNDLEEFNGDVEADNDAED